ncbi:hypothetical protein [Enterovirga rhinocerotis]|uniref:Uncharacterized protein n=1 Tax=Enterovirga rhinocerotis TaxID=1339210 RepID=A0A4R7CCB3_9HYPH|nr:hypothetical protein [Enterovirga rhinocerotis]TDR94437.1 hypothetical protein EV668_1724 [Enterovirga rhinocerotis]
MRRRRTFGASGSDDGAVQRPFEVEARAGHAWFARREKPREPVERRSANVPALRQAELVLSGTSRAVARRMVRIPADSIVSVSGSGLRQSFLPAETAAPRRCANDNVAGDGRRVPTWLREMLFLAIFVATLAGTYYLGRQHAAENVIIVPETSERMHRIT